MQPAPSNRPSRADAKLDELLVFLGDARRRGGLTSGEAGFIGSLMKQSRRPRWRPSDRQLSWAKAIRDRLRAEAAGPLVEVDDA
ncbi:MAG: hypothetical protein AAF844_05950 [Pseudomonadota bacterium]